LPNLSSVAVADLQAVLRMRETFPLCLVFQFFILLVGCSYADGAEWVVGEQ
jgi:hypothetical protein